MSHNLTPREIVARLDEHIIGQDDAKRAVAIAVRNRWRRRQLDDEMQKEVAPKNILMRGPTGVGKTEIARRLATLTGSPFIKVEATKYTEVGYYGRDVESMIRELVESAISQVSRGEREKVKGEAQKRAEDNLLEILCPEPPYSSFTEDEENDSEDADEENDLAAWQEVKDENEEDQMMEFLRELSTSSSSDRNRSTDARTQRTREKMRKMLQKGKLDDRMVEINVEQKRPMMMVPGGMGMDQMDMDFQGIFDKIMPRSKQSVEMNVAEAKEVLFQQACDDLINDNKVQSDAIDLAENLGIIFLDEIDKVVASEKSRGADVSREGVQRDLLPIVEGTTVQTKYGYVKTDHILFVAAGAFHRNQPSDLMPELQGRFPIRVDLEELTEKDFLRILTEPSGALTKQYEALLATEQVSITFTEEALAEMAKYAFRVNQSAQNIGARRLATIMEKLLEDLSFEASEQTGESVEITRDYVQEKLAGVAEDEDLSKFIL